MNTRTAAAAIALSSAVIGSSASAAFHQWTWNAGDTGGINNYGGAIERVDATFHTVTERMTWDVTFSNQITHGISLAVSDGPNPKNHAGELALLYIDLADLNAPLVTAYGYNGRNDRSSYYDGDNGQAGHQTPDKIHSANHTGWINDITVTDNAGKRTVEFDFDASVIRSHPTLYPKNDTDWWGTGFGEQLGLWMHTFRTFDAEYDQSGYIQSLSTSGEGWFDGAGFETVPTPGTAALAITALACFRRRRAA